MAKDRDGGGDGDGGLRQSVNVPQCPGCEKRRYDDGKELITNCIVYCDRHVLLGKKQVRPPIHEDVAELSTLTGGTVVVGKQMFDEKNLPLPNYAMQYESGNEAIQFTLYDLVESARENQPTHDVRIDELFTVYKHGYPEKMVIELIDLIGLPQLVQIIKTELNVRAREGEVRVTEKEAMSLQVCKVENPMCRLKLGTSILLEARATPCDVCCGESNFCRECCCVLCCDFMDGNPDTVSDWIQCAQPVGGGTCGHSAHLRCVIANKMGGVLSTSGLDVEYLCRRCEQKMDLLQNVFLLVQSIAVAPTPDLAKKNATLAYDLLKGTARPDSKSLETLLKDILSKAENGENIQAVVLQFCDGKPSGIATAAQELYRENNATKEKATEALSLPMANNGTDGRAVEPVTPEDEPMELDRSESRSNGRTPFVSSRALILSEEEQAKALAYPEQPVKSLVWQYEKEIQKALKDLKEAQDREYVIAKDKLMAQMNKVMDQYQVLDSYKGAPEELTSTEATIGAVDVHMDRLLEQVHNLKQERSKFESMLQIGSGFGSVPRELLRTAFSWPPDS